MPKAKKRAKAKAKVKSKKAAKKKTKKKAVSKAKVTKKAKKKASKKVAKKAVKKAVKKRVKKTKSITKAKKKSKAAPKRKIPTKKKPVAKAKPKKTGPQFLVAVAQLNTNVGDIATNTRKIVDAIFSAKEQGAQVVVFPELTISGYPPKDLLLRKDFIDVNLQKFIEIVGACRGITAIFGFINEVNGAVHNAVAVVKDQKILAIENKEKLPSHSYFDENKYFVPGKRADLIDIDGLRCGVALCPNIFADQAHVEHLANKGAELIITIGASPYAVRKPQEREQITAHIAKKLNVPILYCNNVGAQESLVFDGASFFTSQKGKIVSRAPAFKEALHIININERDEVSTAVNQAEEVYQAITLGIRDHFAKTRFTKAVIGVSGGIDSAVTLALVTHALGPENVHALILPSKVSSKETMMDAKRICEILGVQYKRINIDTIAAATAKVFGYKYEKREMSLVEQNIQARVRAQLILGFANKENALMITCVNKSSLAIGHCILNGDMSGSLAPIADLYKTQLYTLAEFINKKYKRKHKKNIIPDTIIKRAPSQELHYQQKDSDDIPDYETLDKVLQFYISHRKGIFDIAKLGFDAELARQVAFMVQRAQFKREQLPVGIAVSATPLWSIINPIVSGWRG